MKFIQQFLFALVCFLVLTFNSAQEVEFLDSNSRNLITAGGPFYPCSSGTQCKSKICLPSGCK